ncbi:GNAT family N-acetyltransferase [Thiohalomonas denitrificans]|uniref:Acetyltransferase (GNAT) domain-containing protein n=1 Tax=Thiohalomonas denitrificans TaxID=415747 RepID=A0A1G5PRD4_9GAMM|nr:GNAT family N-acetyltransferase [Thiohalomonas denitrificans]SCZ52144.1 Acetyltransferase (GNAT) domain-containing protein [Thiohalomonas denitrificans]
MQKYIVTELTAGSHPPQWLISGWERLVREHGTIRLFQTPMWVLNYWQFRYREATNLRLLVGKDADQIIGIIPWVIQSSRSFPFFSTWRTVHAVGEYDADWICHPDYRETFVRMACDYFTRERRSWFRYLHSAMREDSGVLEPLKIECQSRGIPFRYEPSREIPFLETTDPRLIEQRLAGKFRQELGRKARKLQQLGPVSFENIAPRDAESLRSALGELFTVEASGWKGRAGTAIVLDPHTQGFWRAFTGDAAEQDLLMLHFLRLGDKAIAAQLGAVFGGTYYSLKLGYDEQFRSYGPGALMMRHTIQFCIDDPAISTYDFTGPAMPYMKGWTSRTRRAGMVTLGTPRRGVPPLFQLRWYGRKKLTAAREFGRAIRPTRSDARGV